LTVIPHDFDIIDGHHHVGDLTSSLPGFAAGGEAPEPSDFAQLELATRLRILDEQGVRQAIVIAGHSYLRPNGLSDTRQVNNDIAAYRDGRPDRFPAAVGIVEPLYGDAGLPEVDRCATELGLVGLSFHVRFQGVSLDSPWVHRCIERMGPHGLVPYLHAIGDSPEEALWKVDALAGAFPDMKMFVLDAFSNFEQAREVAYVLERRENLYFDTALAYTFSLIEPQVRRFGAQRFFYGSDIYSWPIATRPSHVLAQLLESSLTDSEKTAVLGGTLRSLLRLREKA
jgi:predicted TIM-barrel fold metal-dependent hydrolase